MSDGGAGRRAGAGRAHQLASRLVSSGRKGTTTSRLRAAGGSAAGDAAAPSSRRTAPSGSGSQSRAVRNRLAARRQPKA